MPIPANQIINAEVIATGFSAAGGSNATNFAAVFHYRRTATINPPSKSQLEAIFQTNICLPMLLCLNARYTQIVNTVRWMNDAVDQAFQFPEVGVGGVAGDPQSTLDAVFVLLRTGFKGKSYRGSKHFGPLSEADATIGDVLNAAALLRFATLATAMITPLVDAGGNTWVPQVYSRTLSQFEINPTNIVATDVIQIAVNHRVGRMKRREVKSVY